MTYSELKQCQKFWENVVAYSGEKRDWETALNELSGPVVWETTDIDWRYYVHEPVKKSWDDMPILGRFAIYAKAVSDYEHDDWDRGDA